MGRATVEPASRDAAASSAGPEAAASARRDSRSLSWLDAVKRLAERVPGPPWVAYVVGLVVFLIFDHALRWAGGGSPFGEVSPYALLEVPYVPAILGAAHALDAVARRALETIRPALEIDDDAVDELRWDLTHTPPGAATAGLVIGSVTGVLSVASSPGSYGLGEDLSLAWVPAVVFGVLAVVAGLAFLAQAIHQLRLVSRIHRDLVRIDLFRLEPLYAFASLTAWTGIALIAITVYGIGSLALLLGSGLELSVVDLATVGSVAAVAVACFVLPLLGLHGRIQAEKDRRRAEAGGAVAAAVAEVHARIREGRFDGMAQVNDGLAAATSALATISRVSTWPWRPETIRGFAGAVSLPVIVWTITALLGRVL